METYPMRFKFLCSRAVNRCYPEKKEEHTYHRKYFEPKHGFSSLQHVELVLRPIVPDPIRDKNRGDAFLDHNDVKLGSAAIFDNQNSGETSENL
jgi:hypothetical protein